MTDPWHSCSQMFYLLLKKFLVKYLFFFFFKFFLTSIFHRGVHEPFSSWQVVLQSFNFNFYSVFCLCHYFKLTFFFIRSPNWLHVFIVFWFITVLLLFCSSLGVHHVVWLPRPLKWLLVTFTEFTGSRLSRNPSSEKVWLGFLPHPIGYSPCCLPYNSSVWRFWYWIN